MRLPFFKQIEKLTGLFVLFALLSTLDARSQSECGPGTYWDASVSLCLPSNNCPADINDDGLVAVTDLLLLLSGFSDVCPCEVDSDGDGVCDEDEVLGCVDIQACNYFIDSTEDDGTCVYPGSTCNVGGANGYYGEYDNDCTCQDLGFLQVTFNVNMETEEVAPSGVFIAGGGFFGNPGDNAMTDEDGDDIYSITVEVPAGFSSYYVFTNGSCGDWSCKEWLDGLPCGNDDMYDYRFLPDVYSDIEVSTCFGQCSTDGTCTIYGCVDSQACNFEEVANTDDGSCVYPSEFYNCDGDCIADSDGDGICDELEILGCTFDAADNFDPLATEDDGSCEVPGCIISIACNYNPSATYDDGSCFFSCPGCTDSVACNYDPDALQENGSCQYPFDIYGADNLDCDGNCLNDEDGDGVCTEDEVFGCTDAIACNYVLDATEEDESCEYETCAGCMDEIACNYDPAYTIEDEAGCDYESCAGCMYEFACNYDPEATIAENETCEFGSCAGCTDPTACNYNPTLTVEDGSCEFETCAGCMNPDAPNFDPTATIDDESCDFGNCGNVNTVSYHGFEYSLLSIGGECWFTQNLRTAQYANGDSIPFIGENSDSQWENATEGARTIRGPLSNWQGNDVWNSCSTCDAFDLYGYLYNGYTKQDDRGICPSGYHVPSQGEFETLYEEIGYSLDWYWIEPITNLYTCGANLTGWAAQLYGGKRAVNGWYSSNAGNSHSATYYMQSNDGFSVAANCSVFFPWTTYGADLREGYYIRCVKD